MLLAFNNGNNGTANVLCLIAAILFGLAALSHIFTGMPARDPAAPARGGYWGWTPALVDAGLCLLAIAFLVA